jgi:predicted esterase
MTSSTSVNPKLTLHGPIPIRFGNLDRSYYTLALISNNNNLGTIIAIHPYGGTAEWFLSEVMQNFALQGFKIIAPNGIDNSFNGGECCGHAMSSKLPDADFIGEIIHVEKIDKAFVLGWSNGGFLATRIVMQAMLGNNEKFNWVRGIAAFSGQILNPAEYDNINHVQVKPIPVLLVHGQQDDFVNILGCCPRLHRRCCCNIISSNDCMTTMDVYERFVKLNCDTHDDFKVDNMTMTSSTGGDRNVLIAERCDALTMLTILPHESHRLHHEIYFNEAYPFFCSAPGMSCPTTSFERISYTPRNTAPTAILSLEPTTSSLLVPDVAAPTVTQNAASVGDSGGGGGGGGEPNPFVSFMLGCIVSVLCIWLTIRLYTWLMTQCKGGYRRVNNNNNNKV